LLADISARKILARTIGNRLADDHDEFAEVPGSVVTFTDAVDESDCGDKISDAKIAAEQQAFENLPESVQLQRVTDYLRKAYNFCHWCGEQFSTQKELHSSCPGDTADDH
jgi:hypothetical protein